MPPIFNHFYVQQPWFFGIDVIWFLPLIENTRETDANVEELPIN